MRLVGGAESGDAAPRLFTARAVGARDADDGFEMLAHGGAGQIAVLFAGRHDGRRGFDRGDVEDRAMRIAEARGQWRAEPRARRRLGQVDGTRTSPRGHQQVLPKTQDIKTQEHDL